MEIKIKVLIGLQDCDIRIKDIKRKQKEGPIKIQMLKESLNVIEDQLEEGIGKLEAYKRERRRTEKEIEDLDSQVNKSNIKLGNIKSNKEYRAVLKEINDLKVEKSLLEDKAIEIMEEIETLEEKCVANKAKREELEEKVKKDSEEISKDLEALNKELERLEKERSRFAETIDDDLLRSYDFLRERKGGLAVSAVIKGVCQTCHMGIPPQKFNELIRGDELMNCPNCMRIIYWGGDERFQNAVENGL